MARLLVVAIGSLSIAMTFGCTPKPSPSHDDSTLQKTTAYDPNIKPTLNTHRTSSHQTGEAAPLPLDTYKGLHDQ